MHGPRSTPLPDRPAPAPAARGSGMAFARAVHTALLAVALVVLPAVLPGAAQALPASAVLEPPAPASKPRGTTPEPASTAPVSPAADSPWAVQEELWYEMLLNDTPCGYMSMRTETREDQVRTVTESHLRMARMGQVIVLRTASTFVETAQGRPIYAEFLRESGAAPVRTTMHFESDGVRVVDEQQGRANVRRLPALPAGWLTPNQERQFVRRRLAAGADRVSYDSLAPNGAVEVVRTDMQRTGQGKAQVEGRSISVTHWQVRSSMMETPSSETRSADGVLVEGTTDLGVGLLRARLSDRARVMGKTGAAEVMARSFIPLRQQGAPLLRARSAELRLTAPGGRLADLPSAGAQRAVRAAPDQITVQIDTTRPQPMQPGDDTDPRYTSPSVLADSQDPHIQALTDQALRTFQGKESHPLARADALRKAVHAHLTHKNLASGFATATEAAASRAGDCTEHAVLLVACLRHAGIPARAAAGLVYVAGTPGASAGAEAGGNAFGWHMWTQALVDGAWHDLDAVLPPDVPPTHPGRVLVAVSPVDGASMDGDFTRIVEFIGSTRIEIVRVDGQPARELR